MQMLLKAQHLTLLQVLNVRNRFLIQAEIKSLPRAWR